MDEAVVDAVVEGVKDAVLEAVAAQERVLDIRASEHAAAFLSQEAGEGLAIVAHSEEVAGLVRVGMETAFKADHGVLIAALDHRPQRREGEKRQIKARVVVKAHAARRVVVLVVAHIEVANAAVGHSLAVPDVQQHVKIDQHRVGGIDAAGEARVADIQLVFDVDLVEPVEEPEVAADEDELLRLCSLIVKDDVGSEVERCFRLAGLGGVSGAGAVLGVVVDLVRARRGDDVDVAGEVFDVQAGIEVYVLFGGDGGIRAHIGNADQLRGGVERPGGDAVVLARGDAHVDVAAQRIERDVAAKLCAQFALHGVARLEHALGEHAALVGVGDGAEYGVGDGLHADAVQSLYVRAVADGGAHGADGDVLGKVVVGADADADGRTAGARGGVGLVLRKLRVGAHGLDVRALADGGCGFQIGFRARAAHRDVDKADVEAVVYDDLVLRRLVGGEQAEVAIVDVERRSIAHLGAHAVSLRAVLLADAALSRGDVDGDNADADAGKLGKHVEAGRVLGGNDGVAREHVHLPRGEFGGGGAAHGAVGVEVADAEEVHVDAGGERFGAGLAGAESLHAQPVARGDGHAAADSGAGLDVGRSVGHVGVDVAKQADAGAAAHGQAADGGLRALALVLAEHFEAAEVVDGVAGDARVEQACGVGHRRIDGDAQGGDVHLDGAAFRRGPARADGGDSGLARHGERAVAADAGLRGSVRVRRGGIGGKATERDVRRRAAGGDPGGGFVVVADAHGERARLDRGPAQFELRGEAGLGAGDGLHQRHVEERDGGTALHVGHGAHFAERLDGEIAGDIEHAGKDAGGAFLRVAGGGGVGGHAAQLQGDVRAAGRADQRLRARAAVLIKQRGHSKRGRGQLHVLHQRLLRAGELGGGDVDGDIDGFKDEFGGGHAGVRAGVQFRAHNYAARGVEDGERPLARAGDGGGDFGGDAGDGDVDLDGGRAQFHAAQGRLDHGVGVGPDVGRYLDAVRARVAAAGQRQAGRICALRVGVAGHHADGDAVDVGAVDDAGFGVGRAFREHAQIARQFEVDQVGAGGVLHARVGHGHVDARANKRARALHKFDAGHVLPIEGIRLRNDLQGVCAQIAIFDGSEVLRAVHRDERAHADADGADVQPMEAGGRAALQPRFHEYVVCRRRAEEFCLVAGIVVGDGHVDRAGDGADVAGHGGGFGKRLAGRGLRAGVDVYIAVRADGHACAVQFRGIDRAHLRVGHADARGDGPRARAIEVGAGHNVGKHAFHGDVAAGCDIHAGDGGHGVAPVEGEQHVDGGGHRAGAGGEDGRFGEGGDGVAHAHVARSADRSGTAGGGIRARVCADIGGEAGLVDGDGHARARRHRAAIDAKQRRARGGKGIGGDVHRLGLDADAAGDERIAGDAADGERKGRVGAHRAAAKGRRRREVLKEYVCGHGNRARACDAARAGDTCAHRALRAHQRDGHAHGDEAAAGRQRRRQHIFMAHARADGDILRGKDAAHQFRAQRVVQGDDRRRNRHAHIPAAGGDGERAHAVGRKVLAEFLDKALGDALGLLCLLILLRGGGSGFDDHVAARFEGRIFAHERRNV